MACMSRTQTTAKAPVHTKPRKNQRFQNGLAFVLASLSSVSAVTPMHESASASKALFHPIRLALTGEAEGLELDLAVPAIDRAKKL